MVERLVLVGANSDVSTASFMLPPGADEKTGKAAAKQAVGKNIFVLILRCASDHCPAGRSNHGPF